MTTQQRPADREAAWAQAELQAREKYLEDGATVDMTKLRGAGFFSRGLYFGEFAHRIFIWQSLARESEAARRKLTATEADALSQHSDQLWRSRSVAQPVSLAVAAFMAFRTRKVFKFPFVNAPMKWFNSSVFPSERLRLAEGQKAKMYWHATRFLAYCPPSWLVTTWVTYEWSLGTFEHRKRNDPRLRELTQQVNANRKAELAKRFPNAAGAQQQQQQTARGGPQGRLGQPMQSSRQQQQAEYRDDASPTNSSGNPAETWGNADTYQEKSHSSSSASPSSFPSATASSSPQASSTPSSPSYPTYPTSQSPQQQQNGGWGDSPSAFDDDSFDDMSPVSPAARRAEAVNAAPSSSAGSGSAWDRVRQSSQRPGPQQQRHQPQQQPDNTAPWGSNPDAPNNASAQVGGAGAGWDSVRSRNGPANPESYTYSAADEEREQRQYDKDKAQRDFDAMIERERKGQGVSGGGSAPDKTGSGRGWWS
ncbi:hypothetical protein Micbo1qcDRAFT_235004 [Microdochium bolleyi]|uniref:Uncharacterized protein n=1 Tax=Microdochium bolleyi TaxID=196109 RepID=A0A136IYB9_9PEZI|nr:hypothetical protein Micbo1qcDRAFT_235004 [Microdochium bolleyi]